MSQVLDKSYDLFVNGGYSGTKEQFDELLKTNELAVSTAYNLYKEVDDQIGIDEYKQSLQGEPPIKKKEQPAASKPKDGVSKPVAGSSASQGPESFRAPESARGMATKPMTMEQARQAAIKKSYLPEFEKTESAKEAEAQLLAKPEEIVYEEGKAPKYGRKESKYFTGGFGDALDALSNPFVPGGEAIADFIDDMGRAVGTGLNNAGIVTPSNEMMIKGPNVDRETISKYLQAAKEAESMGPSDEMSKFYNIYEAEGKDLMGLLKGLAYSPGAVPELIVSSFSTLLNPSSATAAGSTVAGFTAGGATAGAVAGGVGAGPGAVGGFLTSIPWAMGAASASLETGLTFSELLRERIEERGLEFNEEGVRKILEDPEALSDIRNKSLARGATIGAVDALTGRLAGRVGAKLDAGTNASRIKAAIAAGGIEAAGGSAGEATARAAIGQEMDVAEIGLEGIAEVPMAIPSVVAEVLKRPSYKVNGEVRSEADVEEIINTSSPEDLAKIKIEVKNDTKGLNNRIQEKIIRGQVSTEVKESNPDLSEEDANSIVDLEMELKKFQESKTQSGKDRAAAIRSQIKTIQENAVQKQATGKVPVQPTAGVSQTMEEGKPQPEPKVPTTEGVQEEAVPAPGQEKKIRLKNGDELTINETTKSTGVLKVVASDKNGDWVGFATFDTDEQGNKFPISMTTKEGARRQGLMTGIYDYLKNQGYNIIEGKNSKSEEGTLFEQSLKRTGQITTETAAPVSKEKVERNLDEGPEQNKGIEISSLKRQINAGLGEDMSLTPEEVTELSKIEFTVLPKEDIDKSDVNKPIILIRKRGTPKLTVSEALQDAKEEGFGDTPLATLSDYFEIVDGRHRIKKAIESGVGLNAVVITEQQYENATGTEVYFDKQIKDIVDDLEVNTLDEAITELESKLESGRQRREYTEQTGRDVDSDLDVLLEEKRFREKTFEDENIQDTGVPATTGAVQQEQRELAKQKEPTTIAPVTSKREQVKASLERLRDAGLVRSAETGKPQITQQEIDAQMALTDAMAAVWRETTGRDDFYDTFIDDIKEGDIDALRQTGGVLFQDEESPKRPISRVTLEVFEKPEFQKMRGQMVSPNSISDLMKSRGKAIEKEIISSVLNYAKYKDQKKISFDEFRDDVETQIMKLEKIRTSSYSSYGMDNLGSNEEYGSAETIILNSPINHGSPGHFPNDFIGRNIESITWEIKQIPGTEQYVAIDANMPRGTTQDQLSSYIGTAGPYEDVKKWIDTRNNISSRDGINVGLFGHIRRWFNKFSGVYNLAELQSDYFQKHKASYELYAQKISRDEIDEYLNKNFFIPLDKKTSDILKKEFGLTVKVSKLPESTIFQAIDENGNIIAQESYSYSYTPKIGYTLNDVGDHSVVVDAAERIAEVSTEEKELRFFEIKNEYLQERRLIRSKEEHEYIKGRIEEIKKTEAGASILNQFIASQKVHEIRLFREALKDAAESGANVLRFPTPYTISIIEGYVNDNGTAPYEIISGNSDYLYPGDQIEYAGDKMTVVESSGMNITVAPSGQVFIIDESDAVQEEVDRQVEDALYNLKQLVGDIKSITKEDAMELESEGDPDSRRMGKILNDYFRNNPEEETVSWDDVEQKFSDYIYDVVSGYGVEDLVSWASEVYYNEGTIYAVESRRATESFAQPNNYQSDVDESDFMESLDDDQGTVVKKYQELGDMIRKMRPDAKIIEDENGKKWIETSITDADRTNPIIAFQEEGGKVKGAIDFSSDNKASIYIFDGADISTLAHEATGHLGRRMLEQLAKVDKAFDKDYKAAMKWAGVTDGQWTMQAEEKFARGFERYLAEGKAPTKALKNVFEKLKTWLTNIYKYIKGSSIDIELTPEITAVFDNLLRTKQEAATEKAGSFQQKASKIAEKIRSAELPRWVAGIRPEDGMTIQTKGISVEDLKQKIADAVVEIGKLLDQGVSLVDAVRQKVDELVSIYGEKNRRTIEQNMMKEVAAMEETKPEGYDRLMNRVDDIINRGRRAGKPDQEIMDNVIKNVQSRSTEYANATNTQQEQIIRDIREKFGAKEKKAPSVRKVTGTPKNKVETDEMAALKSQIRLEARAARDAKKDLNGKRQMLAEMINDLARQGRITSRQAASLVAKSNKINLDNPVMIDRFIAYADKVFEDAEYADKLSVAKATRKKIKKLSKNKDKPANLTDLAKKFADIDPSYISDIDEYNRVASEFADGLVGSRARAEKVKISNGIIESDVSSYMATAMQEQEQAILEQKKAEIEALGIDAADMTIEQMNEILAKGEKITKYNESIVRDVLNNAFRIYGSIVNSMIESGVDPFTGEDISGGFTEKQKQIVKKFMDMDLNILTTKEALAAIDSLMNFMYNNSTAGMEATVAFYEGELNARKAERSGVSGKPLKMYWSPKIGRMFGEQFANLPVLVERIFKGFTAGQKIKRLMGLSDLTVGKSTAEKTSNNIVSAYVSKFYKTKPNGQKFNTRFNNVERGMLGFMSRNINGTPEEVTAEFQRRKGVVEESIARLMQGNKDEIKKGQIYQDVYERILEDSESIEDVSSKADAINKEAVEWWMNEWASKYDQMADLSLNVYNRNLGSDINYTPDRFSRMMSGGERVDVNELESSFEYNNNTTYMKEAGSLMKAIRPDKDQLSDGLYIDLSFDNVNSSAMYDALIDIHTAYPIRQISGFINSDSFKKLIPNAETRDVLVKRINLAIRSMKSKMPYDDSELSSFFKKLDKITKFGVSQALGGVLQPVKQTVPAMMNTLVNSGRFDLSSSFNKSIQSFIDRSGYAIANRGIESLANVSKINKIIEQASESTGQKAMDLIEKANEMWLKVFLVAPDVFVARASWMTYYEKSLRNQGIDVSTIDWDTHEINEEAGDYAQLMVDRQQNISDSDLSGKFFKSENPVQKFITRTAFGFSGFRLNQTMRLVTDITVLTSKSATAEDKKIAAASASGFAVEMLTFRLISGYAAFMLGSLTLQMMGREEDEEEKKKRRNNIINGQLTGSIQDLISPIPPVDVPVSMAASAVAGYIQDEMNVDDENRLTIYGNTKREYLQSFGSMGVTAGTLGDIIDLTKLGITGAYEDQYGREKEISEEDKDMMLYMAGLTALSAVSLAPAEARSISRNAEKFAKRKSETEERRVKQQEQKEKTEKEFLKKYNPDEYERIYGKGSPTYEIEQQLKKIESNIRKQMKQED